MRALVLAMCGLALFGCSKPAYSKYADEKTSADLIRPPAEGSAAADAVAVTSAPVDSASTKPIQPAASTGPMLAYSYQYGLESPAKQVRLLIAKHEKACNAAGFAVCQLTGSTIEQQGKDSAHAVLSLRATPAWLATFKALLAEDAKAAGGRVIRQAVTSEDLSRQIIDVEAALKAKTALRDRLQAILETRPGKTSDLVEVETALSKVQGELDAAQSELTVMRQRVATSDVTVDYASQDSLAPDSAWSPVRGAINSFVRMAASGLGAMISLFAVLLPWILVLGGVGWLFRKRLARSRRPGVGRPPRGEAPAADPSAKSD